MSLFEKDINLDDLAISNNGEINYSWNYGQSIDIDEDGNVTITAFPASGEGETVEIHTTIEQLSKLISIHKSSKMGVISHVHIK